MVTFGELFYGGGILQGIHSSHKAVDGFCVGGGLCNMVADINGVVVHPYPPHWTGLPECYDHCSFCGSAGSSSWRPRIAGRAWSFKPFRFRDDVRSTCNAFTLAYADMKSGIQFQLGSLQPEYRFPEKDVSTRSEQPFLLPIVLAQPVCLESSEHQER